MDIKSGWKTSEFWGKIALQVGTIWAAVGSFVPPKYAAIIIGVAEVSYGVIRGSLKIVQLIQAAKSTQTTITTTQPVTTIATPA